ncbi:MAG TPA: type II secretion system F family protein [Bryobacteraceae bacterium]|jgi:tight adherence protein C|nr:type II secretion system F family protein [Bryobacteraceae bacterium]
MLFATVGVFILIVGILATLGLQLWVRPKAAIDRVTATAMETASPMGHPSLAWREMVNKLGSLVPSAPKDSTVMLRRLMRAGLRGPNALKMLYGSKAILAVASPAVAVILTANSNIDPGQKILIVIASLAAGFFGPNEYVRLRAKRRQKLIRKGLPNALDLMVVCVESGLGLDQAIVQVAKELQFAHPEISQEFGLMNLEMKAGSRRADALRNLADRTGVEEVKKLVAVLIQADRFGTSIAQSLRGHSEFMRVQTRQMAEEKAAKLGVKLVFPIFFCILPSLFVVTVGPVLVRIVRDLIPMMLNM